MLKWTTERIEHEIWNTKAMLYRWNKSIVIDENVENMRYPDGLLHGSKSTDVIESQSGAEKKWFDMANEEQQQQPKQKEKQNFWDGKKTHWIHANIFD